jgi:hypothetical protein
MLEGLTVAEMLPLLHTLALVPDKGRVNGWPRAKLQAVLLDAMDTQPAHANLVKVRRCTRACI